MAYGLVTVILVADRCGCELFRRQRLAYVQVNVALRLGNAGDDADEVLVRRLYVLLLAGNEQFPGLGDVARLIFVGNAGRNDVEFLEIGLEICLAAHIEHLQQALFRNVESILGATLTLCQPDGTLAARNLQTYVAGKELGTDIEFTGRYASYHLDHPV